MIEETVKRKVNFNKLTLCRNYIRRKNFLPFHRPAMGKEEEKELICTLRSGWLTKGPKTEKFEDKIKKYVGSKYAVGTNSCTAALELSLMAIGIRQGDEVITTPMTFPATANVIVHQGAKPVFVDIKKDTFNIDPDRLEQAITSKTKAIIPVHFAGHPCEMNKILKIARKYKLFVIEDAAHALGSSYYGRKIGTVGDLTCFSFYASKNITTGEGGMVTSNNKRFTEKIKLLSLHGISSDAWERTGNRTYRHWETIVPGYKYNMYDIQAALGLVQLRKIETFYKIRHKYVQIYNKAFKSFPEIITPVTKKGIIHSYHLYTVMINIENLTVSRDTIMNILQQENIGIGIHYRALHLHHFYQKTYGFRRGSLPAAEYLSERVISLPLYPRMTEADVKDVIAAVKNVLMKYRKRVIRCRK